MYQIEHFELRSPQVVSLRLPRAGVVRVAAGRLWLTRQGCGDDTWLQAGGSWTAEQAVTVWLSAEPTVDFQIARPVALVRQSRVHRIWPVLPGAALPA